MKILVRADASVAMGTGHIMRCLALADRLSSKVAEVHFVCRSQPGEMSGTIIRHGHSVSLIPGSDGDWHLSDPGTFAWEQDAENTRLTVGDRRFDWLIVDHYGIDYRWHREMRPIAGNLMVIDDLAVRRLDCDLLLDQTFQRNRAEYQGFIPDTCRVLLGTAYALLRSEFAELRPPALKKRERFEGVKNILISLGGTDPGNLTGKILDKISTEKWDKDFIFTVVLGGNSPCLNEVSGKIAGGPLKATLLTDVSNMGELMLEADLAVGAGGTTTWERCAMGLPALVAVYAENQRLVADIVSATGAIKTWNTVDELIGLIRNISTSAEAWKTMSSAASGICDAGGCQRVVEELISYAHN